MPAFSVSCSIPPVWIWLGSCNTNHTTNRGGSRNQSAHSPQKGQTALLGHRGDAPAVLPLVPDTGVEGQAVIAGGGGAGGVRLQHLFYRHYLIRPCSQLGGPGNGVPWVQSVQVPKVIPDPPVVVEWGSAALPHFCDRFAPPPLRTVRTPLDVHGSPSLLHLTKLFCHELACDNLRRPPMFSAVWQS